MPAAAFLRIVVWCMAFSYLGVARNAWMVCKGGRKRLEWLYAPAALISAAPSFALIPALGPLGAALASPVTQMRAAVVSPFLIAPLRPNTRLMLDAVLLRGVLPGRGRAALGCGCCGKDEGA